MQATPLRKLYRSLGQLDNDKRTCKELLTGLKDSRGSNLVSMFLESMEENAAFDGSKQPFLNAASLKTRKELGPSSRGDNRIAYLMSTKKAGITVAGGPSGYDFQYVGRQVPPFRQEGVGKPRSGAGGIDYTAVAKNTPVLGEIKLSGDKNALYAFVQLLTYLSEMATKNQVGRATTFREFCVSLKYPQRFDLHILLADGNSRSRTIPIISQTEELARAFRKCLEKRNDQVLGKVLCLQMDSKTFAREDMSSLDSLWAV